MHFIQLPPTRSYRYLAFSHLGLACFPVMQLLTFQLYHAEIAHI